MVILERSSPLRVWYSQTSPTRNLSSVVCLRVTSFFWPYSYLCIAKAQECGRCARIERGFLNLHSSVLRENCSGDCNTAYGLWLDWRKITIALKIPAAGFSDFSTLAIADQSLVLALALHLKKLFSTHGVGVLTMQKITKTTCVRLTASDLEILEKLQSLTGLRVAHIIR
jgi:hypothetical protein